MNVSFIGPMSEPPVSETPVGPNRSTGFAALDAIAESPTMAVVFASVLQVCVPRICDAASVTIVTDDGSEFRASWPAETETETEAGGVAELRAECLVGPDRIAIAFDSQSEGLAESYRGVLTMLFRDTRPGTTSFLLGQLIIERARAVLERERRSVESQLLRAQVRDLQRAAVRPRIHRCQGAVR
jgi:hypothetical protein